MQGEHGTLTSTTDEHQHQCCRQDECTSSHRLGSIAGNEGSSALAHDDVAGKREAERLRVITKQEDTNEEEHISETRHDKCLLRGGYSGLQRIVESNQKV